MKTMLKAKKHSLIAGQKIGDSAFAFCDKMDLETLGSPESPTICTPMSSTAWQYAKENNHKRKLKGI